MSFPVSINDAGLAAFFTAAPRGAIMCIRRPGALVRTSELVIASWPASGAVAKLPVSSQPAARSHEAVLGNATFLTIEPASIWGLDAAFTTISSETEKSIPRTPYGPPLVSTDCQYSVRISQPVCRLQKLHFFF